jgi:hypothetical protein
MCFGDSYGNKVAPVEIRGHGGMTDTRPPWFRVNPAP